MLKQNLLTSLDPADVIFKEGMIACLANLCWLLP